MKPDIASTHDAQAAWERGHAALAAGEADEALRWLDRAARLAPADDTIVLALAGACLGTDAARAARLFASVGERHDLREALLGLATARLRCGDTAGAVAALSEALSRHVTPPGAVATNEALTGAVGGSGWCAMAGQGAVLIRSRPPGPVTLAFDDAELFRRRTRATAEDGPAAHRLPAAWLQAARLHVACDGRTLLGSPIDLSAIRRVEGCVEWRDGTVAGWAWHPADPAQPAILCIQSADGVGRVLTIRADGPPPSLGAGLLLNQARGFVVDSATLARFALPVRVTAPDGTDLFGSPLDPILDVTAPDEPTRRRPSRAQLGRVDVIMPVRDGGASVRACLDSVLATLGPGARLIVVDDGSREADLVAALDGLARARRIRLVRHERSLGFPRAANAGLRVIGPGRDAVLLNSDTLVPPLWLERLGAAAHAAPDIGTACPLSNNATILSYPEPGRPAAMPDQAGADRLAALAYRANAARTVDIPTGVGFCLFIRRACLDAVGLFREDVFGQGYGEENDLCMRARALGWRNVAATGVFVAHRGGLTFDAAGAHLQRRNAAVLSRLHPGHDGLVAAFVAKDPLAPARRRLDAHRWPRSPAGTRSVLLVTHDQGGGVERHVATRCAGLSAEGLRPIALRPGPDGSTTVSDGMARDFPNLRFDQPREGAALSRFLARQAPDRIEFHHLIDHHPALMALPAALGVPYTVTVHDHVWFCPRVTLLDGARRYCGEPDLAGCEVCVARNGSALDERITVAALRARSGAFLAGATRVVAPSADTAVRMRRHFPLLRIAVVPHTAEPVAPVTTAGSIARAPGPIRVCVVGGISAAKGFDVLLGSARDAAERHLPLAFTVVGLTDDDERLIATGRVFVTGPYREDEAETLIRAQAADLGFLPSIWPETWCFALDECWRAGLDVVAFDIGAQAERIRRTGRGRLASLGLSASAVNDLLLAAARGTGHEWRERLATSDCDAV